MSRWDRLLALLLLASLPSTGAADKFPGIGRAATPAEIGAWDIDVRPDFKGLPPDSGTVAQGQVIWESKCASCHGVFAESNEIFTPIVGGTTATDIKRGHVASLTDAKQPQRTTLMKVATLSSLFDYTYRAMPWNAPRSLSANETYAVLAFMLSLAEIVADDFTLSDQNMSAVQARLPNRYGMTTAHGLWKVKGQPDVQGSNCMSNCVPFVQIGSELPAYARNAHHNLALQNRLWGPYRGADTTQPPLTALPTAAHSVSVPAVASEATSPKALFQMRGCTACHANDNTVAGPALRDIASRYKGSADAATALAKKVKLGGAGNWGSMPMPAQSNLAESEISSLINWIMDGKF